MITGSECLSSTPLKSQTRALEESATDKSFFPRNSHMKLGISVSSFSFMQIFSSYSSSIDSYLKKSHSDLQAR